MKAEVYTNCSLTPRNKYTIRQWNEVLVELPLFEQFFACFCFIVGFTGAFFVSKIPAFREVMLDLVHLRRTELTFRHKMKMRHAKKNC